MNILAKIVEMCAIYGAENCVSICYTYQPKMPESLK